MNESLINTDNKVIPEPNNFFENNKTHWRTVNERGDIKWNKDKVYNFWALLKKHKTEQNDYDFKNYIFPDFANRLTPHEKYKPNDFWGFNNLKTFNSKEIDFSNAIFEGETNFRNITFNGSVHFFNCNFNDRTVFQNCIFNSNVHFSNCTFNADTLFLNTYFTKRSSFHNVTFNKSARFGFCEFDEEVDFIDVSFNNETRINETGFYKGANFIKLKFNDKHKTEFEDLTTLDLSKVTRKEMIAYDTLYDDYLNYNNFKELYKSEDEKFEMILKYFQFLIKNKKTEVSLKNIFSISELRMKEIIDLIKNNEYQLNSLKLNFSNIIFPKSFTLRRVNLSESTFHKSDIGDISFKECNWGYNKRIILNNEEENFTSSEGTYRQLKKNFESNKNWELSGLAYVSEMEMRRKRLWIEKDYFQWFIYSFYGHFGGYTQDFKKPIISLATTIIIFSIIYFFIDYDIIKAIQRGTKGALPYISIDTEKPFKGYWLILKNIELILGGTFLSFFILALRKRFKQ